jgi:hypothetical protein
VNDPRPELKPDGVIAFAPVRLAKRRRRLDPVSIVIGLVAVFLVVAIVHPWTGSLPPPPLAAALKPTIAAPSPVVAAAPPDGSATGGTPTTATEAIARVIKGPGAPATAWGVVVGAGASSSDGPAFDVNTQVPIISISLDGSWAAWTAVMPVVSHPKPGAAKEPVLALKTADLCRQLPDLPSGAEVVTLTWPGDRPAEIQVHAWQQVGWHDEPRDVEPLAGIIEAQSFDGAGPGYMAQADGGPLLDGRYEFRVVDASATTTLSVCIGRP